MSFLDNRYSNIPVENKMTRNHKEIMKPLEICQDFLREPSKGWSSHNLGGQEEELSCNDSQAKLSTDSVSYCQQLSKFSSAENSPSNKHCLYPRFSHNNKILPHKISSTYLPGFMMPLISLMMFIFASFDFVPGNLEKACEKKFQLTNNAWANHFSEDESTYRK